MATKEWKIDTNHSSIGFNVRHMMFSKVNGRFQNYEASIAMDGDDFSTAKLQFEAESQSITTNNGDRDKHLKSQDFFHAEKNPSVKFESTGVEKEGKNYVVKGNLTLNGISKPIVLNADYSGIMKDPWGNDRIALVLKTKVNRKDWNMTWNQALESGGILVSEEVNFDIESQFI